MTDNATIVRAQRLLHEVPDLITADTLMLFELARQVEPLLHVAEDLADQLAAALEPRSTVKVVEAPPSYVDGKQLVAGVWV